MSVRLHRGGPQGAKPKGEGVADILAGINDAKGVAAFAEKLAARQQTDCLRHGVSGSRNENAGLSLRVRA